MGSAVNASRQVEMRAIHRAKCKLFSVDKWHQEVLIHRAEDIIVFQIGNLSLTYNDVLSKVAISRKQGLLASYLLKRVRRSSPILANPLAT